MFPYDTETKQWVTLHFHPQPQSPPEDVSDSSETEFQLFRKGEKLATLLAPQKKEKKSRSSQKYSITPGSNTELIEDTLIAATSGYPVVKGSQKQSNCSIAISLYPLLQLSDDKMFASLNLYPARENDHQLFFEKVKQCIQQEGVTHGIDDIKIKQCLKKMEQEKEAQLDIIAARGVLPVKGKDAFFRFHIDIGPYPGLVMQGGKIDYRERKIFVGVEQDQLIATKVPATEGTAGWNVFGEELPQKPGKDTKLIASGDVTFDPESGEIKAKYPGIISVANGNSIKVSSKRTIAGDIDYSTGNIESKDSVEISGSVKPGFTVTTRGDVVIGGTIDSGIITTQSNAVIRSGLLGKNGSVTAHGDIDIHFVEHSTVQAGGTAIIRKQSYYSTVQAEHSIQCDENSTILGSILISGGDIKTGTIGSTNAAPSTIVAGVANDRYWKKVELLQNQKQIEEKLLLLQQRYGSLAHQKRKYNDLQEQLEETAGIINTLNLIPDTPEFSRKKPFMNNEPSTITVTGSVYHGTIIQIGNIVQVLDSSYTNVVFHLDEKFEKIVH